MSKPRIHILDIFKSPDSEMIFYAKCGITVILQGFNDLLPSENDPTGATCLNCLREFNEDLKDRPGDNHYKALLVANILKNEEDRRGIR